MAILEIDKIIAETNKQLNRQQQLHPDDAIVSSAVLHDQILEARINTLQNRMDTTFQQFTDVVEKLTSQLKEHVAKTEAVAEDMTLKGGNKIEKQLESVAIRFEERLKKAAEKSETHVRRASNLAWAGTLVIGLVIGGMIGSWLGNGLFDLLHVTFHPIHHLNNKAAH